MSTPDQSAVVAELHRRLADDRATLAPQLLRLAIMSAVYASPELLFDIHKIRAGIARVKAELREMGVEPDDHPDDVG